MAQTGVVETSALTVVAPRVDAPPAGESPWAALRANAGWIAAALASVASVYADRLLIKEWLASFMPGARYDETQRGYLAVPGSATSATQLTAEVERMKTVHPGDPSAAAPGAAVIDSLVKDLRARGIAVVFLLPPLHP